MKQVLCRITDNRTLWSDVQLITFDAPELARAMRPGQFALARDPSTLDPYLRRTLWLYRIDGERVAFTLSSHDALAMRVRVGDILDLLAPLGRAIDFQANTQHVLLIGGGTHIAPLIAIAHDAVAQGRAVVVVSYETSVEKSLPIHLLSPEIEYRAQAGLDLELLGWADAVVASGSMGLYRTIADAIIAARYRLEAGFARVLIDLPMPCGIGACYACGVDTTRGVQLTCTHGAWFDLADFENRSRR